MKIKLRKSNLPLAVPLICILLRFASTPTADVSYYILAGYAVTGRAQAIQALTLSWLFGMINSGIGPIASSAALGRYAVIAGASIMALRHMRSVVEGGALRFLYGTLMLGALLLMHSVLFSAMIDVSILKVVSWLAVAISLLVAWAGLSYQMRYAMSRQIFGLLVVIMVASIPLISSAIGYRINGTGFQGVLGHPQAFGAAMALLGAWAGSQMIGARAPTWTMSLLFACSILMVYLSEARTGAFSLVLGLGLSIIVVSRLSGVPLRLLAPGLRSPRLLALSAMALFVAIANWSQLSGRMDAFLSKRTDSVSVLEAYDASRGGLVDAMWENIQENPFFGIGFGIGSTPAQMVVIRDPVFGLPVSAIIEKGVLPIAVLEEIGVFLSLLMAAWFFAVVKRSSKGGVASLAVCLTALLLNMGDSMFFSASGMGMILMVLVMWAVTYDRRFE